MDGDLPRLHYVGDVVVGVVSDCLCPGEEAVLDQDTVIVSDHQHESHDIVPVRTEDEMPDGVDFEHYKRWCRMFAAAPDLLAALEEYVREVPAFRVKLIGAADSVARVAQEAHLAAEDRAIAAIAKAKGGA